MTVRAVRDNNPGNIERGKAHWKGEITDPSVMTEEQRRERRFVIFSHPRWGFRAIARILRAYGRNGIDTVAAIVGRWAPANENNTAAYIRAVAQSTGFKANLPLDLDDSLTLRALARALAVHECGAWLFDIADLNEGVRLALID